MNGRIEQEFEDLDRGWVAAYLQGTTGDIKVGVYGSTAVMAGRLTMEGRYKDRDNQRSIQLYQCIGKATAGVLADSYFTRLGLNW